MRLKKTVLIIMLCLQPVFLWAKDYPASLFGICSDGSTLNTRSIQFAIDYISRNGGGRLVFAVGRYLTGSIELKSNVTIELQQGAVLLGSLNPFDYDKKMYTALVLAYDQEDIGITGSGIIDGQGRYVERNVVDVIHKGLIKDALRDDRPEAETRPMLINFRSCKNVLVRGVTLRNSSSWVETYDQCSNLMIDSIHVDSKAFWNNDGIDIVDCDNVAVTNSFIDSDDDGVCLKSQDPGKACKNILVRNCTIRSSANAIKFGTASLGGFSHIRIRDNKVYDTYRSAVALEAVDGGFIDDVEVDSLQALNTGNLIFLRIGERVAGKKSRLGNVKFNHLSAEIPAGKPDAGYAYEGPVEDMPRNVSPAIVIAGLPNSMIKGVELKNITVHHPGGGNPLYADVSLDSLSQVPELPAKYPEFSMFRELPAWGIYIRHAENIQCENVELFCRDKDYRTPVVMDDVHESAFISLKTAQPGQQKGWYADRSCTGISVR